MGENAAPRAPAKPVPTGAVWLHHGLQLCVNQLLQDTGLQGTLADFSP